MAKMGTIASVEGDQPKVPHLRLQPYCVAQPKFIWSALTDFALIVFLGLSVLTSFAETSFVESKNHDQMRSNILFVLNNYGISPPIRIPAFEETEEKAVLGAVIEGVASRISGSPCEVSWYSNIFSSDYMHLLVWDKSQADKLNEVLPSLFASSNLFRILPARFVNGGMADPIWAIKHELDLTSGIQSSIALVSAREMHTKRIDPPEVWKQVLDTVSDLKGVDVKTNYDIKTDYASNTVFFATTEWRPLVQEVVNPKLVIHEMFHIRLVVRGVDRCEITVDSIVNVRKQHSSPGNFYPGDVSFLKLRRSEAWIDPSEPNAASKAVLRAILRRLTTPVVEQSNESLHETE